MSLDVERVVDGIHDYLAKQFKPVFERLTELETEVKTLKEGKALKYRGVWEDGSRYSEGDCITDHGGLWVCRCLNNVTMSRPPGQHWQLAAKGGNK